MRHRVLIAATILICFTMASAQPLDEEDLGADQPQDQSVTSYWQPAILRLLRGDFSWKASGSLFDPPDGADEGCFALKDPTAIEYDGRWHLFCTLRAEKTGYRIGCFSFADWDHTHAARLQILELGSPCAAPQVFFFTPQKKWFLIAQRMDASGRTIEPFFSTTSAIANPTAWSKPAVLLQRTSHVRLWSHFSVICNDRNAYLFFTSPDGRLWRCETPIEKFPAGWSEPAAILKGDFLQGARVYHLKRLYRYLLVVEAMEDGHRYCKAYVGYWLDGGWSGLSATAKKPFASVANVRFPGGRWADSIGNGELLRDGYDERMDVNPLQISALFHGVSDDDTAAKGYGQIPWRIGLLRPTSK